MTYKETLKSPIVLRLSIIQLIAYFGAWFSNVAIFSMMVEFEAGSVIIAFVTATYLLPAVLLAPISGAIIDKIPFKALMVTLLITELIMTLSFLMINSLDDIGLLMVILFIRSSAASIFFTTEMSLLPRIISGKKLQKANEIHSIIWSFTYAAGMAAGGLVVHVFSTKTAFIIDALFFVAALAILLKMHFDIEKKHVQSRIAEMIKEGFIYLKNHKEALHLILLHACVGLTSVDTLVTLLADYQYKYIIAVPLAIGWINATRAIALMIGPILIGKFVSKLNLHIIFFLQGTAIIIWAFLQYNFYFGLAGIFITGFFTTTIWSLTYAMLQEKVESHYLGRVIAYNDMAFMLSNIVTTLFIGYAAQAGISLVAITVVLGTGFLFAGYYYMWYKKHYL